MNFGALVEDEIGTTMGFPLVWERARIQSFQTPLIQEYTLNHDKKPYMAMWLKDCSVVRADGSFGENPGQIEEARLPSGAGGLGRCF